MLTNDPLGATVVPMFKFTVQDEPLAPERTMVDPLAIAFAFNVSVPVDPLDEPIFSTPFEIIVLPM